MITNRLKNLLALSIPLFIVHGVEEIYSGLWKSDSHVHFMFAKLATLPTMEGLFILMQAMLWLTLIIGYLLLLGPKWQLRLMFILGISFVYETYHVYKVVAVGGYYPGFITAIPIYIVGFLFWEELIKSYKRTI